MGSVDAVAVESSMTGLPAGPTADRAAASSPAVMSCQERLWL